MTLISTLLIFSFTSFAQNHVSGKVFALDSQQKELLFTSEVSAKNTSGRVFTEITFRNLHGEVSVQEKGEVVGTELQRYEMDRPQTNEKGAIEQRDGRLYFTYEKAGKKKTSEEKVKGEIVATVNFNDFVLKHWDHLKAGNKVDFRFAVWDRLETVGFTLQKKGESDEQGQKALNLVMKPSSFVIAALVDPVHFWYSVESKRLLRMKGRTAPKVKVKDEYKDLDAEVLYQYEGGRT